MIKAGANSDPKPDAAGLALEGRAVVVTGGAGALGSAVVSQALRSGAMVLVPLRSEQSAQRLEQTLTTLTADHRTRLHVTTGVNLADQAAVDRFYAACPPLWASLHAAGGFAYAPIADTDQALAMAQIETNLLSCLLSCRAAAARMVAASCGGRLVNVTARPGLDWRRGANMSAYAAAKAGVCALTVALAEELRTEGILVNAVAPAIINTAANRAAMPDADPSLWVKPEVIAAEMLMLASPNSTATGTITELYGKVE